MIKQTEKHRQKRRGSGARSRGKRRLAAGAAKLPASAEAAALGPEASTAQQPELGSQASRTAKQPGSRSQSSGA